MIKKIPNHTPKTNGIGKGCDISTYVLMNLSKPEQLLEHTIIIVSFANQRNVHTHTYTDKNCSKYLFEQKSIFAVTSFKLHRIFTNAEKIYFSK